MILRFASSQPKHVDFPIFSMHVRGRLLVNHDFNSIKFAHTTRSTLDLRFYAPLLATSCGLWVSLMFPARSVPPGVDGPSAVSLNRTGSELQVHFGDSEPDLEQRSPFYRYLLIVSTCFQ